MNTANQYTQALVNLMPRGELWDCLTQSDSNFYKLLSGLAEEFARVGARASDLMDETDPRTIYEMLFDWETWLGLPNECSPETNTLAQRRQAVLDLLTAAGGQSRQYYIELAARLGYDITITEYFPNTIISPINYPLYGAAWRYVWQINAIGQGNPIRYFTTISGVNEPLATRDGNILECAIGRLKPAHTRIIFNYGD